MKTAIPILLVACICLLFTHTAFTQTTSVTITLNNAVQTAPNIFEYDIIASNTGNTSLLLRGYSAGVNHATGLNGGGTISHSFVSRDPILNTLPAVSAGYTAASQHLRLTTVNASAGNEVPLLVGTPIRLATMRVTSTVNFPVDFNPSLMLQTIAAPGRTQCILTCIVTPPGSNYTLVGTANSPGTFSLLVLTGIVNTPCFILNGSNAFQATLNASNDATCYGASNGSASIVLSGGGSGTSGTYTVNYGTSFAYTSNALSLSSLSAGTYTVNIQNTIGCADQVVVDIDEPYSINAASACASYVWQGTTYTASGLYTRSFSISAGCDSVSELDLTIYPAYQQSTSITASGSYTWPVNNTTYTVGGNYMVTASTINGCDSTLILHLNLFQLQLLADQQISCFGSNDGTLLASVSGGTGDFRFDLDGANLFSNTTGYFFNVAPGTHTICVKELNSGVISCGTELITEPDPITATFSIDSLVSCISGTGQISINISGGVVNNQPYLTLWSNTNGDTLNDQNNDIYATTLSNLPADTYTVRVEDDNGCVALFDTTLATPVCGITLQLQLLIQGYYAGSGMMVPTLFNQGETSNTSITDSLLIQLHDIVFPYAVVASSDAVLQTNGQATCTFNGISGLYYLSIHHRNALETWSANPVNISGSAVTYNFTDSASKAFGNNMIEMEPGIWAFYSGDIDADENIDLIDNGLLETDINLFLFGYVSTDINGDGNVDLLDAPIIESNINNFIFSNHP